MDYGRLMVAEDINDLLDIGRGTCSTKHAFVKHVAKEQGWSMVKLISCLYRMNGQNTPGVDTVLKKYALNYIPESHCYLIIDGKAKDITFKGKDFALTSDDILSEFCINANDIGPKKTKKHKDNLAVWLRKNNYPFTVEEIWKIREACITQLFSN